jgi:probable addiction module antidote protein
MAEEFTAYDVADYLEDIEDAAAYLQATLEDNPEGFAAALGVLARSGSMEELSRRTGVTREGLYKALSGNGNPRWNTLYKVFNALGLQIKVEPAGKQVLQT